MRRAKKEMLKRMKKGKLHPLDVPKIKDEIKRGIEMLSMDIALHSMTSVNKFNSLWGRHLKTLNDKKRQIAENMINLYKELDNEIDHKKIISLYDEYKDYYKLIGVYNRLMEEARDKMRNSR